MIKSKFTYLSFIALFLVNNLWSQSTNVNIGELRYLCKTWGYLKYYHPNIIDKKVDWNETMINELSHYLKNKSSFEESIKHLFEKAGPYKRKRKNILSSAVNDNLSLINLDWLTDTVFPSEYSSEMQSLFDNYDYNHSHSIKLNSLYILVFNKEREVYISDSTSIEERLWVLFDYWNKIEYYWPNRHLLTKDWDDILDHYIKEMLNTKSATDVITVMFSINNSLNDSHTLHLMNEFIQLSVIGRYHKGIEFEIVNNRAFVDKIINKRLNKGNRISVGDELIASSKGSIEEIYKKVKEYAPFSNDKFIDLLVQRELEKSLVPNCTLEIKRAGKISKVRINSLNFIFETEVQTPIFISNGISYFNSSHFPNFSPLSNRKKKIVQELLSKDTVIIDLRENPPWTFKGYFSKYLYEKGVYFNELIPKKNKTKPGEYTVLKSEIHGGRKNKFDGLLVLLVDSRTGSIGEYTAMVLQQYKNTITVGTPTWGITGYSGSIKLIGYTFETQLTVSAVYKSNNLLFDNSGVELDFFVDYTVQDNFDWSKDYILESALRYIRSEK